MLIGTSSLGMRTHAGMPKTCPCTLQCNASGPIRRSATHQTGAQRKLRSHNAIYVFLTNVLFRISKQNRRTLRCKTRSGRVVTENRNFGRKTQKTRPKKKRGKNLDKTTETETTQPARTQRNAQRNKTWILTDQKSTKYRWTQRNKPTTQTGNDFIDRKKQFDLDKMLIGTSFPVGNANTCRDAENISLHATMQCQSANTAVNDQ